MDQDDVPYYWDHVNVLARDLIEGRATIAPPPFDILREVERERLYLVETLRWYARAIVLEVELAWPDPYGQPWPVPVVTLPLGALTRLSIA